MAFPSGLFPSSFPISVLYVLISSPFVLHSHPIMLLDLIILIILCEECKFWSSSLRGFLQPPVPSTPLSSDILKHPQSMLLPYMRDQVSQPYTTTHIIILYLIIFTSLDSRPEDKRFWTEWWQTLSELIFVSNSSRIIFWFVTVVPKRLNCSTLHNEELRDLYF
jgi:hypothetical protein